MIVFWLLVALLSGAAVAALVVPMLRARAGALDDDPARRLGVLRHRRREIEDERAAGRLDDEDAEQAIDQLAGEAAGDLTPTPAPSGHGARGTGASWALALILAVAVPLAAVVAYLHWGTPTLVAGLPGPAPQTLGPEDLRQALEALDRRVREQPDDAQAWTLLAQARRLNGDFDGSIQAFAEASRLQPRSARALAELAETIAASREGDFSGRPEQLLEQALALSPDDPKALALMGAAQYRLGRPGRALDFLSALLAQMDPESEQARQIGEVATRIAGEAGRPPPPMPGTGGPVARVPAPATPGTPPQGAPPAPAPAAPAAAVVRGRIRLAPALAGTLPAGATLFISARAAEGPRMPVAASRQPATVLAGGQEFEFALGDAQVLDRQRLLSATPSILIEARVSASGDALRAAGDLLGSSPPVAPGAPVDIVIDQVLR